MSKCQFASGNETAAFSTVSPVVSATVSVVTTVTTDVAAPAATPASTFVEVGLASDEETKVHDLGPVTAAGLTGEEKYSNLGTVFLSGREFLMQFPATPERMVEHYADPRERLSCSVLKFVALLLTTPAGRDILNHAPSLDLPFFLMVQYFCGIDGVLDLLTRFALSKASAMYKRISDTYWRFTFYIGYIRKSYGECCIAECESKPALYFPPHVAVSDGLSYDEHDTDFPFRFVLEQVEWSSRTKGYLCEQFYTTTTDDFKDYERLRDLDLREIAKFDSHFAAVVKISCAADSKIDVPITAEQVEQLLDSVPENRRGIYCVKGDRFEVPFRSCTPDDVEEEEEFHDEPQCAIDPVSYANKTRCAFMTLAISIGFVFIALVVAFLFYPSAECGLSTSVSLPILTTCYRKVERCNDDVCWRRSEEYNCEIDYTKEFDVDRFVVDYSRCVFRSLCCSRRQDELLPMVALDCRYYNTTAYCPTTSYVNAVVLVDGSKTWTSNDCVPPEKNAIWKFAYSIQQKGVTRLAKCSAHLLGTVSSGVVGYLSFFYQPLTPFFMLLIAICIAVCSIAIWEGCKSVARSRATRQHVLLESGEAYVNGSDVSTNTKDVIFSCSYANRTGTYFPLLGADGKFVQVTSSHVVTGQNTDFSMHTQPYMVPPSRYLSLCSHAISPQTKVFILTQRGASVGEYKGKVSRKFAGKSFELLAADYNSTAGDSGAPICINCPECGVSSVVGVHYGFSPVDGLNLFTPFLPVPEYSEDGNEELTNRMAQAVEVQKTRREKQMARSGVKQVSNRTGSKRLPGTSNFRVSSSGHGILETRGKNGVETILIKAPVTSSSALVERITREECKEQLEEVYELENKLDKLEGDLSALYQRIKNIDEELYDLLQDGRAAATLPVEKQDEYFHKIQALDALKAEISEKAKRKQSELVSTSKTYWADTTEIAASHAALIDFINTVVLQNSFKPESIVEFNDCVEQPTFVFGGKVKMPVMNFNRSLAPFSKKHSFRVVKVVLGTSLSVTKRLTVEDADLGTKQECYLPGMDIFETTLADHFKTIREIRSNQSACRGRPSLKPKFYEMFGRLNLAGYGPLNLVEFWASLVGDPGKGHPGPLSHWSTKAQHFRQQYLTSSGGAQAYYRLINGSLDEPTVTSKMLKFELTKSEKKARIITVKNFQADALLRAWFYKLLVLVSDKCEESDWFCRIGCSSFPTTNLDRIKRFGYLEAKCVLNADVPSADLHIDHQDLMEWYEVAFDVLGIPFRVQESILEAAGLGETFLVSLPTKEVFNFDKNFTVLDSGVVLTAVMNTMIYYAKWQFVYSECGVIPGHIDQGGDDHCAHFDSKPDLDKIRSCWIERFGIPMKLNLSFGPTGYEFYGKSLVLIKHLDGDFWATKPTRMWRLGYRFTMDNFEKMPIDFVSLYIETCGLRFTEFISFEVVRATRKYVHDNFPVLRDLIDKIVA